MGADKGSMQSVGNYILGDTIGTGSFGKVKLAEHRQTGHAVAIKILNRKKIVSLDMGTKVKREIQNMKLFRHPHIIKMYEVIGTSTDIFMIMEYVPGGELFNLIVNTGGLPVARARKFFQQIISGVDYCHRHRVVHRDLKPENLLLDRHGNVKIADFGLSNMMTDGDFLETSCGSPNYAAPEVISGQLYAGPEVDVWSCGVILYALLAGRLPFVDDTLHNLFRKIKAGEFTMPPTFDADAKSLLESMLVVDPVERATLASIMQHAFFIVQLPDYLIPSSSAADDVEVNMSVVMELCKRLRIEPGDVVRALMGDDDGSGGPKRDDLKAAYHLMLDNTNYMDRVRNQDVPPGIIAMATSPPLSSSFSDYVPSSYEAVTAMHIPNATSPDNRRRSTGRTRGSSLSNSFSLNSSMPQGNVFHTMGHSRQKSRKLPRSLSSWDDEDEHVTSANGNGKTKKRRRSKWHLGIRSKNVPYDVMHEVYQAMKRLNVEWKTINPYHIRCRYHVDGADHPEGGYFKMVLQLYKLGDNYFLLDFKDVDLPRVTTTGTGVQPDHGMAFFHMCSKILKELTLSPTQS